ncbi:TetR family transcriptional regulator C-terminal domain-containing protein [Acinetobacter baumannii]|uniref:TetR family transcriptional regulator C-terminal domain-containing protein n=1 Tax=Acinetobacter baumannii TaxID=470 RepID=UPI00406C80FD
MSLSKKVENYLLEAQKYKFISEKIDCRQMAIFFWMGWQGAIMQAKLTRSNLPLDIFISIFMAQVFDIPQHELEITKNRIV